MIVTVSYPTRVQECCYLSIKGGPSSTAILVENVVPIIGKLIHSWTLFFLTFFPHIRASPIVNEKNGKSMSFSRS
jgi:hypothetical protein